MRSKGWLCLLLAGPLAMAHAGHACGQSQTRAIESPAYGTVAPIIQHIGFTDFSPGASSTDYGYGPGTNPFYFGLLPNTAGQQFYVNVRIPTGALLSSAALDFCDTDPSSHITMEVIECSRLGENCMTMDSFVTVNPGGSGCGTAGVNLLGHNYTMQNMTRQVFLRVTTLSAGPTHALLGGAISYYLQVTPAPATATFTDVPVGHPQHRFVEALVAAGITAGCGGGNFCPTAPLTRGQMAVFLSAALGLHFPN